MAGRVRNRNRNQVTTSSVKDEVEASFSTDSPILAEFVTAARHLTERQDRHERLVKLSRDITIESKRIIFLLHSAVTKEKSQEQLVEEAKQRIGKLINGPIKAIAMELESMPAHLHSKAITGGLQEFVEAWTLCSLIERRQIMLFEEVQKELIYKVNSGDGEEKTISTLLSPLDYMLGLADLSGEMMRRAINGISSGDMDECFFACDVLRKLYAGFLGLFGGGQVLSAKLSTTRANVYKVEYALYNYTMRGCEAIPSLELMPEPPPLAVWDHQPHDNEDFY